MTFNGFIQKYYLPDQRTEIISLLNDLCIYGDIECAFNDFYEAADSRNKIQIISQFVLTVREFLTALYMPLSTIGQSEIRSRTEQLITEFSVYLIREASQFSGLELAEYFGLLLQTARKTYSRYTWGNTAFETLFNHPIIRAFANAAKEKAPVTAVKFSKPLQLCWNGDKQLDLFVGDLIDIFPGVKTKKQLYQLFDGTAADFKIELPSKHLLPFLALFYNLHEAEVIKVIGNRGLFVFLREHLQAPPNDRYPKRDFRKLRHEAEQNENQKKDILCRIKPLLSKYCSAGR